MQSGIHDLYALTNAPCMYTKCGWGVPRGCNGYVLRPGRPRGNFSYSKFGNDSFLF